MDTALVNRIVSTATRMSQARQAEAVQTAVLRRTLDLQEASATVMLDALAAAVPVSALTPTPTSTGTGTVGTQLDTWA